MNTSLSLSVQSDGVNPPKTETPGGNEMRANEKCNFQNFSKHLRTNESAALHSSGTEQ